MARYKPVTHVIFDLDGTLINTEEIGTDLLISIAKEHGKDFTPSQRAQCVGVTTEERIRFFIQELNLPLSIQEIFRIIFSKFQEISGDKIRGVQLKPGVERLVRHLHKNKVPLAIATSSRKETYNMNTKNCQDLLSCFHHIVLSPNEPEVKEGKPAPDVFLVCANRFDEKPPPEKVLVIEDAPIGVQAAVAAEMQVVIVPDPLLDAKFCENATLTLKTLESFQPELFGLPPFPNEQ